MRQTFPLYLLLAGCAATASGPLDAIVTTPEQPILVKVFKVNANTYDLAPWPTEVGVVNDSSLLSAVNQAVQTRARELCAPAAFVVAASASENFLEAYPRTRIRCN